MMNGGQKPRAEVSANDMAQQNSDLHKYEESKGSNYGRDSREREQDRGH